MDDAAAAAAGVGKDTLFRAFGSRAALIQALWELRTEPLRRAIESGPLPLGPGPIRASASWPFSTPRPGRREWSGS
jgi:AcrR family transcriptional regulator